MNPIRALWVVLVLSASTLLAQAPPPAAPATRADAALAEYFKAETRRIERECLNDIKSPEDWAARKDTLRNQLFEMLSLDPLPERTDLKATITGGVDHSSVRAENLHCQSRPGRHVTRNPTTPK